MCNDNPICKSQGNWKKVKVKGKKKALGLLLGLFLTLIGMSYESKSEGSDTLAPQEQ